MDMKQLWIDAIGSDAKWEVEYAIIIQISGWDVFHFIIGKIVLLMDIGEGFGNLFLCSLHRNYNLKIENRASNLFSLFLTLSFSF